MDKVGGPASWFSSLIESKLSPKVPRMFAKQMVIYGHAVVDSKMCYKGAWTNRKAYLFRSGAVFHSTNSKDKQLF